MAIFRRRNIQFVKAGLIGSLIASILWGLVFIGTSRMFHYKISELASEEESGEYQEVYLMKRDIAADEQITRGDCYSYFIPKEILPLDYLPIKDFIGKFTKIPISKNTLITKELLWERLLTKDMRLHNYNFIKLNDKLIPGDYIDIRIVFSDGADYVLLTKKKIIDLSIYSLEASIENSLWIEINEEEILRLSSAVVDAAKLDGCYIYAIKYLDKLQESLQVNYPVNEAIRNLIITDPNIVKEAEAKLSFRIRDVTPLNRSYESVHGQQQNNISESDRTVNNDRVQPVDKTADIDMRKEGIEYLD